VKKLENTEENIHIFLHYHPNCLSVSDLKSCRSSVHRRGNTVMNDSPEELAEAIVGDKVPAEAMAEG